MLHWVVQAATAGPVWQPLTRVDLDEAGIVPVRYALRMSQGRASREVGFAVQMLEVYPELGAAPAGNRVAEAHARVFSDTVGQLGAPAAEVLLGVLLRCVWT